MQLWQVEQFFLHKKVPVVLYRYLFVKKNVFNWSELHFSEVTSYKIHTLIQQLKVPMPSTWLLGFESGQILDLLT